MRLPRPATAEYDREGGVCRKPCICSGIRMSSSPAFSELSVLAEQIGELSLKTHLARYRV